MPPEAAQALVNFCLLVPGRLPPGFKAEPGTLRPEGPPYALARRLYGRPWSSWCGARVSSYRFRVTGRGRSLRVKQYLYDFGPLSALDHAALFDHYAWRMRPVPVKGRLLWVGRDYARRPCVTGLAWGTCFEVRDLSGRADETELLAVAAALQPLREGLGLLRRPFAERSYWSRWPRYDRHLCVGSYRPPSSLWRLRWPWAEAPHAWEAAWPERGGYWRRARRGLPPFRFDSACWIGPRRSPRELQALFVPSDGQRHRVLWLRELSPAAPLRRPLESRLPELESFSGLSSFPVTVVRAGDGTRAFVASGRRACGPHDALWWRGGRAWLLQLSAAPGSNVGDMVGLLGRLLGGPMEVEGAC